MYDDQCVIEAVIELAPRDPLDVITGNRAPEGLAAAVPQRLPQSSFEIAWRLAH